MAKNMFCEITWAFDLLTPESNSFSLESKGIFVPDTERFGPCVPEMSNSHEQNSLLNLFFAVKLY